MDWLTDKLGPATYDSMPVKPKPGQRVRITFDAVWSHWDVINRPVTKPGGSDTSHYTSPRNTNIEIIE